MKYLPFQLLMSGSGHTAEQKWPRLSPQSPGLHFLSGVGCRFLCQKIDGALLVSRSFDVRFTHSTPDLSCRR